MKFVIIVVALFLFLFCVDSYLEMRDLHRMFKFVDEYRNRPALVAKREAEKFGYYRFQMFKEHTYEAEAMWKAKSFFDRHGFEDQK